MAHNKLVMDLPDIKPGAIDAESCSDKTLAARYPKGDKALKAFTDKMKSYQSVAGYNYTLAPGSTIAAGCATTGERTDAYKDDCDDVGVVLDASDDPEFRNGVKPAQLGATQVCAVYEPGGSISYWFFYPYNGFDWKTPLGKHVKELHEGDWEHIVVNLGWGDYGDEADSVNYFEHHCPGKPISVGGWYKSADSNPAPLKDGHAVVYSALRGHASYPDIDSRSLVQCWTWHGPNGFDATSKGTEWDTFNSIDDAKHQPWRGFQGNWGTRVAGSNVAAVGPGTPAS